MSAPEHLYHFTCVHARRLLGKRPTLSPQPQPTLVKYALVWLTDLTEFRPADLGLQSSIINCDRTECCYEIVQHDDGSDPIFSWREWCAMVDLDHNKRSLLEFGRAHNHWWVATMPVRAKLLYPNPLVRV